MIELIGWLVCAMMFWYVIDIASKFKRSKWTHSSWRYIGLLLGFSLAPSGVMGILLGWENGLGMLLTGILLYLVSTRRRVKSYCG